MTILDDRKVTITYYESGAISGIYSVNAEGILHGAFEEYYSDGRLKSKGACANGSKEGDAMLYLYENTGNEAPVIKGYSCAGSEFKGEFLDIIPNVVVSAAFKNGKEEGIWRIHNSKGSLIKSISYHNGYLSGKAINYYEGTDKIRTEATYSDDKLNGPYAEYYGGGQKKLQGSYKYDKQTGLWVSYWIEGKIKEKANYVNGEINGLYESYSFSGEISERAMYKDGVKVKEVAPSVFKSNDILAEKFATTYFSKQNGI